MYDTGIGRSCAIILPVELPPAFVIPRLGFKVPAGFPSPATDYIESRIDLNRELIQNPTFTFYMYAEGNSMAPVINDGALLVVDRKLEPTEGCTVVASVNQEYCVKYFFKYPDGSIELRPENPECSSIFLADDFEGEFEIFGCVTYFIQKPTHASRRPN